MSINRKKHLFIKTVSYPFPIYWRTASEALNRRKRPFIKDVRSHVGGGVCPVRTFFGHGGSEVLQMRTSAIYGAKTSNFWKFMVCPNGKGGKGLSQWDIFWTREVNFSRFCVDVLNGRERHQLANNNYDGRS